MEKGEQRVREELRETARQGYGVGARDGEGARAAEEALIPDYVMLDFGLSEAEIARSDGRRRRRTNEAVRGGRAGRVSSRLFKGGFVWR